MDLFAVLFRELNERKAMLTESVMAGGVRSYEEYCKLVGRYQSLEEIESSLKDLEKRYIAD